MPDRRVSSSIKPAASSRTLPAKQMLAHRILALDSAGSACSAAVWAEGAVQARQLALMERGQSERLVPMASAVMAEAGLAFDTLDAIAVTQGPGGFTGVRIGMAAARGLALATSRPLLGVSSFLAVAAGVPKAEREGRQLAVLIEAKRAEIYLQVFGPDLKLSSAAASVLPDDLVGRLGQGSFVLAGDGLERCRAYLQGEQFLVSAAPGHADAGVVAQLAASLPLPAPDAPPPQPIYLRDADTTLPGKRAG